MKDNRKYRNIEFNDFSGGINNERSPEDINDNEVIDALNFYINDNNQLETRYGVTKVNETPSSFPSPIKSIFGYAFNNSRSENIILTSGSNVYLEGDEGEFTSITGSNTFPSDVYWNWLQYKDLVIGFNGANSGSGFTNPVKWDGEVLSQLKNIDDNAPAGKYGIIFNERLFIVSADNLSLIYYSKIGDPEDFQHATSGQIEVGLNDGSIITGITADRGQLFIFKRTKIYRLTTGRPNTDPSQWNLSIYNDKLGCISHFTIFSILDDVLFLSHLGLASLRSSELQSEYSLNLLDRKVKSLRKNINSSNVISFPYGVLNSNNYEYWLAVPTELSRNKNAIIYVMNFSNIGQQSRSVAFTKFDGLVVGYCYKEVLKNDNYRVYIGGESDLYFYDKQVFNDNFDTNFTKNVLFKPYNFGIKAQRKEFDEIGISLESLNIKNTSFSLDNFTYTLDYSPSSIVNTKSETFTLTYSFTISGSLWGETTPSIGTWAYGNATRLFASKRLANKEIGRKGYNIQLSVSDNTLNQPFKIECITMFVSVENDKELRNLEG